MFRVLGTHTFSNEFDFYGQNTLDVPFWDLSGLGGSANNRGFSGNRFEDYDFFAASFEYRWQYWRFFDVALFVDSGLVMNDMFRSKEWANPWHSSFGVAVRANVPPVLIISLEYSFSPDSPSGLFTSSSIF
jgi:outer membrane protein assembly factor BamA